jgi:hypothetical protein
MADDKSQQLASRQLSAGGGAGSKFVARSFSGDKKQLLEILKVAISHRGAALIDVISPCVTFNDHEGSTNSYSYVKDHEEPWRMPISDHGDQVGERVSNWLAEFQRCQSG